MKKRNLVICDDERSYAEKLYEYIQNLYSGSFEVLLFTDVMALMDFLTGNQANILLLSEKFSDRDFPDDSVRQKYMLKEHPGLLEKEQAIYKYGPIDEAMHRIMSLSAETETESPKGQRDKPFRVIGVYTPLKRSFQTTFALTLGQITAKSGKTLYLNFEGFSGFEILTGRKAKADIMDLVYFAECSRDTFAYRLESMTEHFAELDYIPPAGVYTAFSGIKSGQWLKLIETIRDYTDYEVLILDLSELVVGLLDILDQCDRIYTIVDSERTAVAKMAQYEALLKEQAYDHILECTKNIRIPRMTGIPTEFELLSHSELAAHIRKIMEAGDE